MAGWEETVIDRLARLLVAESGLFGWDPAGPVPPDRVPLHVSRLPLDRDRAVALTLYPVDSDTGHSTRTVGVQFRIRGRAETPRDVLEVSGALFDILDGRTGYDLGPTPVIRSWEQSGADLPPDDNRRPHATRNYYIIATHGTAHRRD